MASMYYQVLDPKGMGKLFTTLADARIYIANMVHRGIKLPTLPHTHNVFVVYKDLMTPAGVVIATDTFYWAKWEDWCDGKHVVSAKRILPSGNLARN